jgi:hypothetical protein
MNNNWKRFSLDVLWRHFFEMEERLRKDPITDFNRRINSVRHTNPQQGHKDKASRLLEPPPKYCRSTKRPMPCPLVLTDTGPIVPQMSIRAVRRNRRCLWSTIHICMIAAVSQLTFEIINHEHFIGEATENVLVKDCLDLAIALVYPTCRCIDANHRREAQDPRIHTNSRVLSY